MSSGLPFCEARELLRYCMEETHNNTYRYGLHICAEFVDSYFVEHTVVAVKLHLLPNYKKDRGEYEDYWLIL